MEALGRLPIPDPISATKVSCSLSSKYLVSTPIPGPTSERHRIRLRINHL